MLKTVTAIAVPGALGGLAMLYDGTGSPPRGPADPLASGFMCSA